MLIVQKVKQQNLEDISDFFLTQILTCVSGDRTQGSRWVLEVVLCSELRVLEEEWELLFDPSIGE